ncbi:conserved protein of unknown function (plasmid) [Cupriavidus taiwanensis]|uniref:Uncharacterized protein n=1 Tax=Cupriavidus taiwanensis TaxID=164546 RepID=A0A375IUR4_9BURK|nr:conserved protein of unknown function [Cupriavidus taiwanensis]
MPRGVDGAAWRDNRRPGIGPNNRLNEAGSVTAPGTPTATASGPGRELASVGACKPPSASVSRTRL